MATTSATRELPPLPDLRRRQPMPEGHTLHRLATALTATFAGHAVRVSSPQGRFAESAALLDGACCSSAEAWGKHLFVAFARTSVVHVHLGLYGTFDVHAGVAEVPAAGRPGPAAAGAGDGPSRVVRRPARRHRLRAAHAAEQRDAIVARLGPDPLRPTPTPTGPGSGSGAAARRSAAC